MLSNYSTLCFLVSALPLITSGLQTPAPAPLRSDPRSISGPVHRRSHDAYAGTKNSTPSP